MSRKHFEALARSLRHRRPEPDSFDQKHHFDLVYNQWRQDVVAVADVCLGENWRFSRERFYSAAGFEPVATG